MPGRACPGGHQEPPEVTVAWGHWDAAPHRDSQWRHGAPARRVPCLQASGTQTMSHGAPRERAREPAKAASP
eukprot:4691592-Alexandrium_andersonii.AAC.1